MPGDLHSRSAMFTDFPCHDSLAMQRATARNRKFINIGVTPISLYFLEATFGVVTPVWRCFYRERRFCMHKFFCWSWNRNVSNIHLILPNKWLRNPLEISLKTNTGETCETYENFPNDWKLLTSRKNPCRIMEKETTNFLSYYFFLIPCRLPWPPMTFHIPFMTM